MDEWQVMQVIKADKYQIGHGSYEQKQNKTIQQS